MFPHSIEPPYEILLISQAVSEEKMFKECGRQTTTDDGGLPKLRWARKKNLTVGFLVSKMFGKHYVLEVLEALILGKKKQK